MKKKFLVVLLSMLVIVIAGGCTENVEAIQSVDDPQPVVIEPISEPEPEPVSEVVSEPVSEEPSEPEVDPNEELTMSFLEISKECLMEYDTLGLERDGKYYSLCYAVPKENWEKYKIGNRDGEYGVPFAYGDIADEWVIEDDRFVIPHIGAQDKIAWYGPSETKITLNPVEFYGYTVPILQDTDKCESLTVFDNGKNEFDSVEELTVIYGYRRKESGMQKNVRLFDENGNDVFSDFRNLVHGDSYTLKWDEDGEHEEGLKATWCYYKPSGKESVVLDGEKADEITTFDLSSVPSGTYFVKESFAFIEVE